MGNGIAVYKRACQMVCHYNITTLRQCMYICKVCIKRKPSKTPFPQKQPNSQMSNSHLNLPLSNPFIPPIDPLNINILSLMSPMPRPHPPTQIFRSNRPLMRTLRSSQRFPTRNRKTLHRSNRSLIIRVIILFKNGLPDHTARNTPHGRGCRVQYPRRGRRGRWQRERREKGVGIEDVWDVF